MRLQQRRVLQAFRALQLATERERLVGLAALPLATRLSEVTTALLVSSSGISSCTRWCKNLLSTVRDRECAAFKDLDTLKEREAQEKVDASLGHTGPESGEVEVTVLDGRRCKLTINRQMHLSDVKKLIAQKLRVPSGQQRLLFRKRDLGTVLGLYRLEPQAVPCREDPLLHPDGRSKRGPKAVKPDLESCFRVLNEELRSRVHILMSCCGPTKDASEDLRTIWWQSKQRLFDPGTKLFHGPGIP